MMCTSTVSKMVHSSRRPLQAQAGDIVTVDLKLTPEDGFVPEPLFDHGSTISFVLGWGNYLPAIHELVMGRQIGQTVEKVTIDAGWGRRSDDMIVAIAKNKLPSNLPELIPGETTLALKGGLEVLVLSMDADTVTLDANPPLAGSSYNCTLNVVSIERNSNIEEEAPMQPTRKGFRQSFSNEVLRARLPEHFQVATFALGCFWGAELAFMRTPGVVGTRAGYSQGITQNPSYEEVCTGRTQHREAVLVMFDERIISYSELVRAALNRLQDFASQLLSRSPSSETSFDSTLSENSYSGIQELFGEDDDSTQYRYGVYYHLDKQRYEAEAVLKESHHKVELLKAQEFYDAEDYHQQYLYKGGQSARKNAKEKIRCFG